MPDDDITIGELGRRMDRIETIMTAGFDRLGREYVQTAVYAADRAADHARLAALEAGEATRRQQGWQVRLAMTAALMSVPASIAAAWLVAGLVK